MSSASVPSGMARTSDIHATILHLLGIDHERLTVRSQGLDFRLGRESSPRRSRRSWRDVEWKTSLRGVRMCAPMNPLSAPSDAPHRLVRLRVTAMSHLANAASAGLEARPARLVPLATGDFS